MYIIPCTVFQNRGDNHVCAYFVDTKKIIQKNSICKQTSKQIKTLFQGATVILFSGPDTTCTRSKKSLSH